MIFSAKDAPSSFGAMRLLPDVVALNLGCRGQDGAEHCAHAVEKQIPLRSSSRMQHLRRSADSCVSSAAVTAGASSPGRSGWPPGSERLLEMASAGEHGLHVRADLHQGADLLVEDLKAARAFGGQCARAPGTRTNRSSRSADEGEARGALHPSSRTSCWYAGVWVWGGHAARVMVRVRDA